MRTRVTCPGLMSALMPKSGSRNPCSRSCEVSSRMTGSPFFRIISCGLYSDTLAVTWMTRSCCPTGSASAAAASPTVAKARKVPIITASFIIFIVSAFRDRPLGSPILFPTRLRLHGAEAEALVRVSRVPRDRRLFRHGPWGGQGEHKRLGGMMRDMTGQMVMLLVNVTIEDRDVLVRHEGLNRVSPVSCRPVPLGIQIKQGAMGEHNDRGFSVQTGKVRAQPLELGVPDTSRPVGDAVQDDDG